MDLIELERCITRRAFLRSSSVLGVGSTAFNSLLAEENVKKESDNSSTSLSHFAPTARSVIFLISPNSIKLHFKLSATK